MIKKLQRKSRVNKHYLDPVYVGENVHKEVQEGLELLNTINRPIISFFGSHIRNRWYNDIRKLAKRFGESGYAIVTGGGPGVMEAANLGANDANAPSVGYRAGLLEREQSSKAKFTHEYSFKFLFVRRFLLAVKSDALIVFPGGFGTLNELSEYIDLMIINITDKVPIIIVGKDYWQGFLDWIEKSPIKHNMISKKDMKFITVVDSIDEVFDAVVKK